MGTLTTIIPLYNGEKHLAATLQAVAHQTRPADRVIILDNGSTDRSREIAESFSGLKCEWRPNATNIGILGNLNLGLTFSIETDFLHLLMADDLVKPTFYEKVVGALEKVDGISLGYSYNEIVDDKGIRTGPLREKPSGPAWVIPHVPYLARQAELATVLLPAVVFKTDRKPAPCVFENLPQVGDCLFLAEWVIHCKKIIEVPEYLCQYRVHPSNNSSRHLFNLKYSVLDEWQLITTILPWIKEPALNHWIRTQKLKCLFAGRCHVKAEMMKEVKPEYAAEIRRTMLGIVGPGFSALGRLALFMRDTADRLQGRPTNTEEQCRLTGLTVAGAGK